MAAKKADEAPPPIVTLTARGLSAVTQFDDEEMRKHALGTEFDLVSRTLRSTPQHGTYWKTLGHAAEATGRWRNRGVLHRAMKIKLGRVEPLVDMNGRVLGMIPDSTSFASMKHRDFCDYMDEAMAELADAIGYDPLNWMKK